MSSSKTRGRPLATRESARADQKPAKHTVPDLVDPNQRYTIAVASALLKQSRDCTFKQIRKGLLQVIRQSARSVFVPGSEIIRVSTLRAPPDSISRSTSSRAQA